MRRWTSSKRSSSPPRRSVEAHANLGVALWTSDARRRPRPGGARAARLGSLRPEPLRNLGLALRDLGRADEAFTGHRRAAALAPGAIEALLDLGEAAFESGRVAEAEAAFAEAIRLEPRSVASRPSSLAARDALRRRRLPEPTRARPALDPLRVVFSAIALAEAAIRRLPRSTRLGGPLLLGAALLAAAVALRVLPPYVDHYLLRDDLAAVARAPVEDEFQVRDRLAHAIRERGLEGSSIRTGARSTRGWPGGASPAPTRSPSRSCPVSPPAASRSGSTSSSRTSCPGAGAEGGRRRLPHDRHEVDLEDQGRVGRDRAVGLVAVAEGRRDREAAPAAHLHAGNALVPARDHPAGADDERIGLAAVVGGLSNFVPFVSVPT